jgi:drug/metabolite transporter (DMT)-like permease
MLALCAHIVMTITAIWIVADAMLPIAIRGTLAVVMAAFLLPGISTLAMNRRERFAGLALLLVIVIGAAIVEVAATGGEPRANLLLGAAMLEFAVLFILGRRHREPKRSEREQR